MIPDEALSDIGMSASARRFASTAVIVTCVDWFALASSVGVATVTSSAASVVVPVGVTGSGPGARSPPQASMVTLAAKAIAAEKVRR